MLAMLGLGAVLIGVPLYFWRRPARETVVVAADKPPALSDALPFAPTTTAVAADAAAAPKQAFALGEVKVLSCRDARRDLDNCGRLVPMEEALAKAVKDNATCLPAAAGGGTVQYVADVNFGKKQVSVVAPRDGRTVRNIKLLKPCVTAIKHSLEAVSLAQIDHTHVRYKISVITTYPAP